MVVSDLPKVEARVRFPLPAQTKKQPTLSCFFRARAFAGLGCVVEESIKGRCFYCLFFKFVILSKKYVYILLFFMKNPEFVNPPINPELLKTQEFLTKKLEVQTLLMKSLGFDLDVAEDPIEMMEKWDKEGYADFYNELVRTPEGYNALMREGRDIKKIVSVFETLIKGNESLRKDYTTTETPHQRYIRQYPSSEKSSSSEQKAA